MVVHFLDLVQYESPIPPRAAHNIPARLLSDSDASPSISTHANLFDVALVSTSYQSQQLRNSTGMARRDGDGCHVEGEKSVENCHNL